MRLFGLLFIGATVLGAPGVAAQPQLVDDLDELYVQEQTACLNVRQKLRRAEGGGLSPTTKRFYEQESIRLDCPSEGALADILSRPRPDPRYGTVMKR